MVKQYFNSLFWRISATLLLLMLLVGLAYIFITAHFARQYSQEINQQLNANLAQHLIDEKFKDEHPFDSLGNVNKALFGDLMHDMMAVNQGIEVYVLGLDGEIRYSVVLDHDSPNAKTQKVPLGPIKEFIAVKGDEFVCGEDPRNPGVYKAFSAAQFSKDGQEGYIYIILASRIYDSISQSLASSYFLRVGTNSMILTLLTAFLIGLVVLWLLTKNLRGIVDTVRRFKEGDYKARIHGQNSKGELSVLSNTFNDMADTINKNIDELKAVENLRRELIANVSHDLRTPLAIMHGYVETMLMKNDTLTKEERHRYLNIVLKSTEKLKRMVTQLFELSKLEAQQIQPEKEPFFLTELAQDVAQKYEILAKEKNIEIDLQMPKKLPMVFADVALVERVLQNLIDNALKFTPEGGSVSLELMSIDESVEIKISDTGPGIPEQEQRFIFERYHRIKSGEEKVNSSGTGLGLAIVKKILDLHNATIQVMSNSNQGASFYFQLPVYKS